MMRISGNIRKMKASLSENGLVKYELPLYDITEPNELIGLNEFIGQPISLRFEHQINCVVTGKKIKKAYGEGMSFDAFMQSPLGCPSITHPELSTIHTGVALRNEEWERANHLQPHIVYLSKTSGIKVGVTRKTQLPTRWIDQGATEAIILAETPYRQLAGLIEVSLKPFIADKTNWQQMLKNMSCTDSLLDKKMEVAKLLQEKFRSFVVANDEVQQIQYPVLSYPQKVKSLKLDSSPIIEKKLIGIKGQYLLFEDESVLNIRSHAGYLLTLET
jgi:hypothetical protein